MKSSWDGSLYISLFASSYNLTVIITHLSHMLNIQHFATNWGTTQCSLETFTTLLWFGKGSASRKHARDYECAATLHNTTILHKHMHASYSGCKNLCTENNMNIGLFTFLYNAFIPLFVDSRWGDVLVCRLFNTRLSCMHDKYIHISSPQMKTVKLQTAWDLNCKE